MHTYSMHASMLDHASTDAQRTTLGERLGDARICHNAATGVLIARFCIQGASRDEACLAGADLLRAALRASRLSPTIVAVEPAV
jgi:hypothetical protein